MCIIREICKVFGIILEAYEYDIENEQAFFMSAEPTYDWAPFAMSNIMGFKPKSKVIENQSTEVDMIMSQANSAFREGNYEAAFDRYTQCISIYIQI